MVVEDGRSHWEKGTKSPKTFFALFLFPSFADEVEGTGGCTVTSSG